MCYLHRANATRTPWRPWARQTQGVGAVRRRPSSRCQASSLGWEHAGSPSGMSFPLLPLATHTFGLPSHLGAIVSPCPLPHTCGTSGWLQGSTFCAHAHSPHPAPAPRASQCYKDWSSTFWQLSLPALSPSSPNPAHLSLHLPSYHTSPHPSCPANPGSSPSPWAGVSSPGGAQALISDLTNGLRVTWKGSRPQFWATWKADNGDSSLLSLLVPVACLAASDSARLPTCALRSLLKETRLPTTDHHGQPS